MLYQANLAGASSLLRCAINILSVPICIFFTLISFTANAQRTSKPNVIIILSDDIGYEVPTVNGGQSYSTPNIDSMARNGMNFTHCEASPLCSPSRFMLLTGKYNFRNYSIWGLMNHGEKTIGNLMHDAGYKTGWFGKLQLTGLDSDMHARGFDSYLTGETISLPDNGQRYKDPDLYTNGMIHLADSLINGKYSDDLTTKRLLGFIDSNKNSPFFAYVPMSLAHTPFGPTPDDSAFAGWNPRAASDSIYFPSMVKYMDKLVGQVLEHLKNDGIDSKTIVVFSGDNGTTETITSEFDGELVQGGKAMTTEAGTHVPLMMYWPKHIKPGIDSSLVDFLDFFPTLAGVVGTTDLSPYGTMDGTSFYPQLFGDTSNQRQWVFNHYDADPDFDGHFWRWANNKTYKLYDNTGQKNSGNFYNIVTDILEDNPLSDSDLNSDELAIKNSLETILDTMPKGDNFPVLDSIFATNITYNSATLGAKIESDGGSPVLYHGSTLDYAPQRPSFFHSNKTDTIAGLGTFQDIRTGLSPQHLYNYALFAMNGNKDDNTGYAQGSFWTCSSPPLKQPTSFTATAGGCSIILKWNKATFPPANAADAGYLLVYSTDSIKIDSNYRQKTPANIVLHGTILPISETDLPVSPALTDTVINLSGDSTYHFLLIPYTWNGINDSTHNYLKAGALTISSTPLLSQIEITATIKKPSCFGNNNGSITLSSSEGLLPYKYSIDSGAYDTTAVISNLSAGTYGVVVKDLAGCTTSKSVIITQPAALDVIIAHTDESCYGGTNAYIKLDATGGTKPYEYSVNGSMYDTDSIFNGLTAGTYIVSVEDKNGCADSQSVIITQPAALDVTIAHTDESCYGGTNAYIKLDATGGTRPYQYSVNGSVYDTISIYDKLIAGTHIASVEDKNGCTDSQSVIITQPAALDVTIAHTDDSCYGGTNAFIKLDATGGTKPYQYSVNGSVYDTDSIFNGLTAGTYIASVEDKNVCTDSQSVIITQPVALDISITHTNDSCYGGTNAYIKLAATGGTRPYEYSVNGSVYDTVSIYNGLTAGTYDVSVKDKNECTFSTSVIITQENTACPASFAPPANIGESMAYSGELKISVYPNPSASQFQLVINSSKPGQPIFIKVIDMYGKPVFRQYNAAGNAYTFGNSFAPGIYLVQVQQGNKVKTIKVVKGGSLY